MPSQKLWLVVRGPGVSPPPQIRHWLHATQQFTFCLKHLEDELSCPRRFVQEIPSKSSDVFAQNSECAALQFFSSFLFSVRASHLPVTTGQIFVAVCLINIHNWFARWECLCSRQSTMMWHFSVMDHGINVDTIVHSVNFFCAQHTLYCHAAYVIKGKINVPYQNDSMYAWRWTLRERFLMIHEVVRR